MAANTTVKHVPMAQHHHPSTQNSEARDDTNVTATLTTTTQQVPHHNTSCDIEAVDKSNGESLENNEGNLMDIESKEEQAEESANDELGEYLFKAN